MISSASSAIADGRIAIELSWSPPNVTDVRLTSSRATEICRVFAGKSVAQALQLTPMLFSLCGRAQAIAGLGAVEPAMQKRVDSTTRRVREWLVRTESAQEYLWRLLIDLPRLFELAPAMEALAAVRQAIQKSWAPLIGSGAWLQPGGSLTMPDEEARRRVVEEFTGCLEAQVLGCPVAEWRTVDQCETFEHWLTRHTGVIGEALRQVRRQSAVRAERIECLPAAHHSGWVDEIAESLVSLDTFAAAPLWRGRCCETGALAQVWEHPLIQSLIDAGEDIRLTRLVARLVALGDLAQRLASTGSEDDGEPCLGGAASGENSGYGWVETARGLLLHQVELEGESVARYRILAPTEWNFHPDGPLKRELGKLTAGDEASLRQQAELSVLALDPCVAFEVGVQRA